MAKGALGTAGVRRVWGCSVRRTGAGAYCAAFRTACLLQQSDSDPKLCNESTLLPLTKAHRISSCDVELAKVKRIVLLTYQKRASAYLLYAGGEARPTE